MFGMEGKSEESNEAKEKAISTVCSFEINTRIILEKERARIIHRYGILRTRYSYVQTLNIARGIFYFRRESCKLVSSRKGKSDCFDSAILPIIRAVICIKRNEN